MGKMKVSVLRAHLSAFERAYAPKSPVIAGDVKDVKAGFLTLASLSYAHSSSDAATEQMIETNPSFCCGLFLVVQFADCRLGPTIS